MTTATPTLSLTSAQCACGFVSKPTSPAMAAYALRQHSCERHTALAASRVRGVAREAAVDRTPKVCHHQVAVHEHGTRACYVLDRCRCTPCSRANAAVELHRKKQTAYGRWAPYVDAQPVRDHIAVLRAGGMGLKRIAAVSGLPHGALAKVVYGDPRRGLAPSRRVRARTSQAVLALTVELEHLGATVGVDATGTRRRLRALMAAGWSMSELARRLGRTPSNFAAVFHRQQCRASTARAVAELYESLRHVRPLERTAQEKISASRARRYAAARQWPPPMWWDDADLDDPSAPELLTHDLAVDVGADDVAVERFLAGDTVVLTAADRREVAVRMVRRGTSINATALRLHARTALVQRWVDATAGGTPPERLASLEEECRTNLPHEDVA